MTNNTARRVMILAHANRRVAAARFNCTVGEILFSECLKLAWAEVKAEAARPRIKVNEQGFVVFRSRNWKCSADRGTWARVEKDCSITLFRAAKGNLSKKYIAELEKFCATYGQDFHAIACGGSINFTQRALYPRPSGRGYKARLNWNFCL